MIAFGLLFAIKAFEDTVFAIPLVLIFTGFMGLILSSGIEAVLAKSNGELILVQAILGTVVVCVSCAVYAMLPTTKDLSSWGGYLIGAVFALLALSILNLWLQLSFLHLLLSVVVVIVFSAFLIYDVQKIVNGGETNYVSATVSVYLDVFNIFANLLDTAKVGKGDD